MKKGIGFCMVVAVLMGMPLILGACSTYESHPGPMPMYGLPNCDGLHMRNAQWVYNDTYGNRVDVVGRCVQGMMHGGFVYSMNGTVVAQSKFTRGTEMKTACLVGKKHRSFLFACMNEAAAQVASSRQKTAPVQQGQMIMVPVQQGQTVMVPVQQGQAVMVPVQQGQAVMVPAQPGQAVMVPAQQGQPAAVPAPQNQPAP
jgi:hypothetical protein